MGRNSILIFKKRFIISVTTCAIKSKLGLISQSTVRAPFREDAF